MFDQWQLQFSSDTDLVTEFEKVKVKLRGLRTIAEHVPAARDGYAELMIYFTTLVEAVKARGLSVNIDI